MAAARTHPTVTLNMLYRALLLVAFLATAQLGIKFLPRREVSKQITVACDESESSPVSNSYMQQPSTQLRPSKCCSSSSLRGTRRSMPV